MKAAGPRASLVAIAGFVLVASAQASNMILARGNAGAVPPFSLACVRWFIIAVGLALFVAPELNRRRREIWSQRWWLLGAGFCGMFLCGGPVYIAGESTTAVNIALIMSLSPIVVVGLSWLMGLETITARRLIGIALALSGALTIIAGGHAGELQSLSVRPGDLIMLVAMAGWSGYTLLQSRAAPGLTFLARVAMFAFAGGLLSLPFALREAVASPAAVVSLHALALYVFAGLVPGILAYGGFAYLDGRFGSVRTSLVVYLGPVASAVLSVLLLHEPPDRMQLLGGALIIAGLWASLRA